MLFVIFLWAPHFLFLEFYVYYLIWFSQNPKVCSIFLQVFFPGEETDTKKASDFLLVTKP